MPTDYLRLKNLTLGVSIPQNYISKLGLSKARIYFSGSNLLTWKSKDLFVDPEMRVDGLCTFETPALRTYTFGIDAETAIKNSDDLANVRTGLYAAVKGNSSLINYYGRLMFVYGDMRGEDIQYEYNGGSGRANFYYYMEYTTADNFTTSTAVWQMPYVVIARANRLIQAAESGNLTDAAEAKATIDQYDAEAKVLRAMALFDLTRIYGKPYTVDQGSSLGVPIATSPLESTEKPSRSTVAQCYEAIEKDLTNVKFTSTKCLL